MLARVEPRLDDGGIGIGAGQQSLEAAHALRPFKRYDVIFHAQHGGRVDGVADENALNELAAGRALPESPRPLATYTPEIRGLVKLAGLPGLLRARGASWGAERAKLPAGLVADVLAEFDAVVTRHAAQKTTTGI